MMIIIVASDRLDVDRGGGRCNGLSLRRSGRRARLMMVVIVVIVLVYNREVII